MVVLAVIGLILAALLAAAPQLFKMAANNSRESDARILKTALDTFVFRNNKQLPTYTQFRHLVEKDMAWSHYRGQNDFPEAVNLMSNPNTASASFQTKTNQLNSTGESMVAYARESDLAANPTYPVNSSVMLPGRNVLHVWAGYACDLVGSNLDNSSTTVADEGKGNDVDILDSTVTPAPFEYKNEATSFGTGTIERGGAVRYYSFAIVYQLQGGKRCTLFG